MAEIPSTRRVTFYNSRNGDRKYSADSMTDWLLPFFTTGVFNNCFQVTANNDMTVTVSGGYANIKGKTVHYFEKVTLSLSLASGTLSRMDNIVLRRDDTARDIYLDVVPGALSGSPQPPAPDRAEPVYELVLARVRVNKGVIRITQADITDTRMDSGLCGWVMATIKDIDFAQITAQFDKFFAQYMALVAAQYQAYQEIMAGHEVDADQALDSFVAQLDALQQSADDTKEQWFTAFTQWFTAFKNGAQADVTSWFEDYVSTLGPDEAVQLFNKLYNHEQATVAEKEEGVHGVRFHNHQLQIEVGGGWVSLVEVVLGLRWLYLDAQDRTWIDRDTEDLSWEEFENLMEKEA